MAVKGVFSSDSNIQASREGDFATGLLQTVPTGSAVLLALSAGMKSEAAKDTVVMWFEENRLTGQNTIINNAGTGTSVQVGDASDMVAGRFFWVPTTGEYMFILSMAGDIATVERGFGDTPISAVDGSSTPVDIQRVGSAAEENSPAPVAVANIGFPRFNYTEIFRDTWDVSATAAAVAYHTGNVVAKNRRDAALEHSSNIERSFIWGVKNIGVKDGQPFRTMDGIKRQLVTNQFVQTTNFTWNDMDAFLRLIFEINIKGEPNERIALCGNTVLSVLNQIARLDSQMNIEPGETEFGLKINKWMTPYGDITLMTHPLMNESPYWTKDLMVLHPAAMVTRWLRRTSEDQYNRDGTRAGRDGDYGVYTSEVSVTYKAEKTGGYYEGIDTAAAST